MQTSEDTFYRHVDEAYDRWNVHSEWSKTKFWNQLSEVERICVFANSLEYQVLNGGFRQWIENRYCTKMSMAVLKDLCREIGSPISLEVLDMLETIEQKKPYGHFDDRFAKISAAFIYEVAKHVEAMIKA